MHSQAEAAFWSASITVGTEDKPARRIITGRRHRPTGLFVSRKALNGKALSWESKLERCFLVLAEFSPSILSICEQPHRLEVSWPTGEFTHTPDYLAQYRCGPANGTVIEVKPSKRAKRPDMQEKLCRSGLAHQRLGYGFKLMTEIQRRRQPRLNNGELLLRMRGVSVPEDMPHRLATLLGRCASHVTVADALMHFRLKERDAALIHALASDGIVELGLDRPLGPQTQILSVHPTRKRFM